jgi:molybdopterin-containing oxidoreductase family iron-sulfur binding subunit
VEGNPQHPASLGATDAYAQASVLGLYDPDRSPVLLHRGEITPWSRFVISMEALLASLQSAGGTGLRILTGHVTSPTLLFQLAALRQRFPNARWHAYEAGCERPARGSTIAFGQPAHPVYRFDQAEVVVALDSDFLMSGDGHVRYAHDFAERRRVRAEAPRMNRLYAVEATPSVTGALADHRLVVRAHDVGQVARALAAIRGVPGVEPPRTLPVSTGAPETAAFLATVATELAARPGVSLVVPGAFQPPEVHALAHALNAVHGNIGRTVVFTDPIGPAADEPASLVDLVDDMRADRVQVLVIVEGNPVYAAPADLDVAAAMAHVPTTIHLSLYADETSRLATWHVPAAHFLESWSDLRAHDGTATILQPLIEPLYGGKTAHELLAVFLGEPLRSAYDIVRGYWRARFETGGVPASAGASSRDRRSVAEPGVEDGRFEQFWTMALHGGVVPGTAAPIRAVSLQDLSPLARERLPETGLEIIFRPDPSIDDGRFANNAWLQELPKPITKLTWDNAVLLAPATAARLGLNTNDVVELHYRGRTVSGPVLVQPGHALDSATVHLGYGRAAAGLVGAGAGFDANRLRTSDAPWMGVGLQLRATGDTYPLATTQLHHLMHGRDFVRAGTLAEFRADPHYPSRRQHTADISLYPKWEYSGDQWGMSIDNTVCVGCNACVVACQAENNVPIVGKTGVLMQREMHWLRIDHYYQGQLDNPRSVFQPMLCQHCEQAPCEVVCPVAATSHSADGLNQMIYNRCVGTRYCSNNCPYKVRRFNFFDYARAQERSPLKLLMNPDVTVRSLGVMEKCTYCVQRINAARIEAKRDGRPIADGVIVTACQGACPTRAIVFGNVNDPDTEVSRLKAQPHNYALLGELNTRPRTTYLAAIRNPNPALDEPSDPSGAGAP